MTIGVTTNAEGVIVSAPPIVAKFKWQHIDNLRAWLVRQGGYREFDITPKQLRDGEPCGHPGCLHHVTHPCEGCGRIAGRSQAQDTEAAS